MDDTKIKGPAGKRDEGLPPGLHVQLSFTAGPDRGLVKQLWKRQTVLGRGDESDLSLADGAASKKHLEITVTENGAAVRDLGSTNGTYLNGKAIKKAALKNLDEIAVGETVIKVAILTEADEASGPDSEIIIESDPLDETTRPRKRVVLDPLSEDLPADYQVVIAVVKGPDQGKRFEMRKKAATIGRSGADLALSDPDASRKHASIEFVADHRVLLKDLRSKNGTSLNGKAVTVAYLQHGDLIGIGDTVLKFMAMQGPAGPDDTNTE